MPNLILGTTGDDFLIGTAGDDEIFGLEGEDNIQGREDDDLIDGGDGHDTLHGQQGNDTLLGGNGHDGLRGGTGDDLIDGGNGFDRVSYFGTGSDVITNGVTVSLLLQDAPQDTGQGWDTLIGIESLSGTPFNDVLRGDHGVNWLANGGGAGDDSFYGEGGNDLLEVGSGNHWLDGGPGGDTVSFGAVGAAVGGVNANLFVQGVPQNTGQGMMTLVGIEHLTGTPFDDLLTGNDGTNVLAGDAGNDGLVGAGGNDFLFGDGAMMVDAPPNAPSGPPTLFFDLGGAGNDTLDAGAGDDVLVGGGGNDALQGGPGNDQLFGGPGTDTAGFVTGIGPVLVDLAAGFASGGDGNDSLASIENALGSVFDDELRASPVGSRLSAQGGHDLVLGAAGNDWLEGQGGDDLIEGGLGDDTLDGGDGVDTVSYAHAAGGVEVDLEGGAAGADGNDILIDIENAIGSEHDDLLFGSAGDNRIQGLGGHDVVFGFDDDDLLEGGDGQDFLRGYDGNDQLFAGDGHDALRGGNGDDLMDGGAGFDRAAYFGTPGEGLPASGVTVSLLLQGAPQDTGHGWDILVGIEALSGTAYDDVLTGDHGANWLLSAGAAGNDILHGEGGDDLLEVSNGDHLVDGGAGNDTASFQGFGDITGAVSVSLLAQGAPQDTGRGMMTLSDIENLSGTAFDDLVTGDAGANLLAGDDGNDTLIGGDGDDVLYGDGAVAIDFPPNSNFSGPVTIFEDRGGAGDDVLNGGKGNDVLVGGGGDDVLTGDQGDDQYAFGPGSGHDHITDFDKKEVIAIVGVAGVDDMADLTIIEVGKDTVISWDGGIASVTLEKFKASKLSAANFDFGDDPPAALALAMAAPHGPAGGDLAWATVDFV